MVFQKERIMELIEFMIACFVITILALTLTRKRKL